MNLLTVHLTLAGLAAEIFEDESAVPTVYKLAVFQGRILKDSSDIQMRLMLFCSWVGVVTIYEFLPNLTQFCIFSS